MMFVNTKHTLSNTVINSILSSFFGIFRIYIVNTQVGLEQFDLGPVSFIKSLYLAGSQCPEDIISIANLNLSSQGKGDCAVSRIW